MQKQETSKPTVPSCLNGFVSSLYTPAEAREIFRVLDMRGAFDFDVFDTGLFPAVGKGSPAEQTSGYRAVWVRDNVHIAYAHWAVGNKALAVRNALCLAEFFKKQRQKFEDVITGKKDPRGPMNRPHIRFDGEACDEIEKKWPHAQNDALGVFIWFFCTLILCGDISPTASDKALLADFVRFFKAIAYWRDEDSGHWEEQRKISASSIGAVVAGLKKYRAFLDSPLAGSGGMPGKREVDELAEAGLNALASILPWECTQESPFKRRRYDAALLFLIDPLEVVEGPAAERIIDDTVSNLQGAYGIARYPEDSYWGPNYRNIPPEKRTIDLSEDIIQRTRYSAAGMEARWCIFDSVLSVIYGKKYRRGRSPEDSARQASYFNRALSQLIESPDGRGKLLLPEAYFMENGKWAPNDHIPLQWAHANFLRAAHALCADAAYTG